MNSFRAFFIREFRDWPTWWSEQKGFSRHGVLGLVLLYWLVLALTGVLKQDQLVLGGALILFWYLGRTGRLLFFFLLPVILTGVVYDGQKYFADALRGEVKVEFPYWFDKTFFGINTPEGRLTPNEFWQRHTLTWLDLVTGFFYLGFIAIYLGISFYQRFVLPRFGGTQAQRERAHQIGNGFTWSFFVVNVMGYSTYLWFPAAPPWYVSLYGFGPARMDTPPNPAGTIRFDEILGISVFQGMYSKSGAVFGAIPSLHISYPCLAMLFAWQLKSLRSFTTFFFLMMCFSAVYLNHHYILDLIWGATYALITWIVVNSFLKRMRRKKPLSAPATI